MVVMFSLTASLLSSHLVFACFSVGGDSRWRQHQGVGTTMMAVVYVTLLDGTDEQKNREVAVLLCIFVTPI